MIDNIGGSDKERDYGVEIKQMGSYKNFVMFKQDTYADPEEVCHGYTQKFIVSGWYNKEDIQLHHVNFKAYLSNLPKVPVYNSNVPCDSGEKKPELGFCPPVPELGD